MKPNRMIMTRASSFEAVNKSWTLVAAFTLIQFINVSNTVMEEIHKTENNFSKMMAC